MSEIKGMVVWEANGIAITQEEKRVLIEAVSSQNPTDAELKLYFYDCARRGVHPLDRLIFFTKRKNRYVPVVSIDYMRMRAESSGCYAGNDDATFVPGDPYPRSASVTVWKVVGGTRYPFTATARWSEYAPFDLTSEGAFNWRKMPHTMLGKCAGGLALRKAFPGQLSGLYATEEVEAPVVEGQAGEATPQLEVGNGHSETLGQPTAGSTAEADPTPKAPEPDHQKGSDDQQERSVWTMKNTDHIFAVRTAKCLPPGDDHAQHIVKILNASKLDPATDSPQDAAMYVKAYHGFRESGANAEEAHVKAMAYLLDNRGKA